jgi:hypothetical protein
VIRYMAAGMVLAAVVAGGQGCERAGAPVPAPQQKGDPGAHEVHPDYPSSPGGHHAPNPLSDGRWMVLVLGTEEDGSHTATCWINSDIATVRDVPISQQTYDEFLAVPVTGSIPCPG